MGSQSSLIKGYIMKVIVLSVPIILYDNKDKRSWLLSIRRSYIELHELTGSSPVIKCLEQGNKQASLAEKQEVAFLYRQIDPYLSFNITFY